ncbi:MAG: hypothetical protein ACK469_10535, partial [Bacteroidota bacterium]
MRNQFHPYLIYFSLFLLLWDLGFKHSASVHAYILVAYFGIIIASFLFEIADFFKLAKRDKWKPFLRGILPFLTLISVGFSLFQGLEFTTSMNNSSALFVANVILLLSIEIGLFSDRLYSKKNIKPSIVLAGSFIFLIIVGTVL